jgi:hypothetical protein
METPTSQEFAFSAAAELAAESSLDAHGYFVSATMARYFIEQMHEEEELNIEGFPDAFDERMEAYFAREYHRAAEELSRKRGII